MAESKLSSFSLYLTLSLNLSLGGDSLLFPLSWSLTPLSISLSLFNHGGEVLGMVICRFKVWSKTYSYWFCMKLYSPTLTMCIWKWFGTYQYYLRLTTHMNFYIFVSYWLWCEHSELPIWDVYNHLLIFEKVLFHFLLMMFLKSWCQWLIQGICFICVCDDVFEREKKKKKKILFWLYVLITLWLFFFRIQK